MALKLFVPRKQVYFLYGAMARSDVGCCYKRIESSKWRTWLWDVCTAQTLHGPQSYTITALCMSTVNNTLSYCVIGRRWTTHNYRVVILPDIMQNAFFSKVLLMSIFMDLDIFMCWVYFEMCIISLPLIFFFQSSVLLFLCI